ncbi:hypothetical protein [Chitinophaga sp. 212800010-3]|uniref:hypothetical protein n=1 Tax=unclassified Chitinophaga TaxID=2619133 RepID=UPI002DF1380A|nr:GIY-YIG domain-containing protein [Chitinophaga sp. 212800010-3]
MNSEETLRIRQLFDALVNEPLHPFPERGGLNITGLKGVYIIYQDNIVAHVGNTRTGKDGLCQRLNNHIYGQSSFVRNYLQPKHLTVRTGFSFQFLPVANARERVLLEALACGMLCPLHVGLHTVLD